MAVLPRVLRCAQEDTLGLRAPLDIRKTNAVYGVKMISIIFET